MPTSAQTGPRSLTIVLPAYNEQSRIGPALDELFDYLKDPTRDSLPETVDVLVVDDGSADRTAELVTERAAGLNGNAATSLGLGEGVPLRWLALAYLLMWGGQQNALGGLSWIVNRGLPTAGALVLLLALLPTARNRSAVLTTDGEPDVRPAVQPH